MQVLERIEQIAEQEHTSVRAIVIGAGLSEGVLSAAKTRRTDLSWSTLHALATYLSDTYGIRPEYLLFGALPTRAFVPALGSLAADAPRVPASPVKRRQKR
jgi:hypothetical protein